jgi:fructose-bisphosphate aldolase class 1
MWQKAAEYKRAGASFAKFRCAYRISDWTPSKMVMEENATVKEII